MFPFPNSFPPISEQNNSKNICAFNLNSKQLSTINNKKSQLINLLTYKERVCAMHLCKKYTAKNIAKEMNISNRTVEGYIDSIKGKLECYTKLEVIGKLYEVGAVQLNFDLSGTIRSNLSHYNLSDSN